MNAPYIRLGIMLTLGVLFMFLVLYVTLGPPGGPDVTVGVACIALMMAAPMGVLMLLFMPHLFRRFGANLALYAAFTLVFLGAWAEIRSHVLADDQAVLHGRIADRFAGS